MIIKKLVWDGWNRMHVAKHRVESDEVEEVCTEKKILINKSGFLMKKKLQVPNFKSIEEEAEFWDTHDSENYPDYWQPAPDVKFSKNLISVFEGGETISLDINTADAVRKVAKKKKVDTSIAARMLIRERLSQLRII